MSPHYCSKQGRRGSSACARCGSGSSREEEEKKAPPPGLPAGVDWTFNLDATFGAFGFGNSLYRNPRPDAVRRSR